MVESLDTLEKYLERRLKSALPGSRAHESMRAQPVGDWRPKFAFEDPPRRGSVMILLHPFDQSISFPLIKRPEYAGVHSGQISLPGGKKEGNESEVETALRETFEEIGVIPDQIRVLGRLSVFHVIPSNYLITPVIGVMKGIPSFKADPVEVSRIVHAALADLLSPNATLVREITVGAGYRLQAPHFALDNEIVWGATAMILNEFRMILNEAAAQTS
jgi:8-oxo-dGTP pyrophosphatase MutT (NUDIX family)